MQADIRTIAEWGGYAVSAITSITVQNTLGIQEFFDIPAEIVSGQIEAIMNDMQPDIVKIGMIRRVETLNVVIDAELIDKETVERVIDRFLELGETDWRAEPPVPRDKLPFITNMEALMTIPEDQR